jgi:hypothetical protein
LDRTGSAEGVILLVKQNDLRKVLLAILLMGAVVLLTGYFMLSWQRYTTIRTVSTAAQSEFYGDRIEALVSCLKSNAIELDRKNRIIWVLGELRDDRAIAELTALSRPGDCDHRRYVCQDELRNAVKKIKGGTPNPYFWQHV